MQLQKFTYDSINIFQGQTEKLSLPALAKELDQYLAESENKNGLKDVLEIKEANSFEEFFELLKGGKERDIAFVILHQLLRGNRRLQVL